MTATDDLCRRIDAALRPLIIYESTDGQTTRKVLADDALALQRVLREAAAELVRLRERVAELEERARMVDVSISCAAMGHYKRGESMHNDYKTCGLNDVLDLRDKWLSAEAERDVARTELKRLHATQSTLGGARESVEQFSHAKTDEITALRADLARYQARDAEMETEMEGLRKDAERYRWVRVNPLTFNRKGESGIYCSWDGPKLDAAIDAARGSKSCT